MDLVIRLNRVVRTGLVGKEYFEQRPEEVRK